MYIDVVLVFGDWDLGLWVGGWVQGLVLWGSGLVLRGEGLNL